MFAILVNRGITAKVNIGAIETEITNINNIVRKAADLDNSIIGQFTTFENFVIPLEGTVLFGKIIVQTDGKDTIEFGKADDFIGTNFELLINTKILSPTMNELQNIEILFTIEKGKVPIIRNLKNISLGFCIIEGLTDGTKGVQSTFNI